MVFLEEITTWSGHTPNHVYILNDQQDRLYAYVQTHTQTLVEFRKPLDFHVQGRKFRPVANQWNYHAPEQPPAPQARTWTVAGSQGNTYQVQLTGTQYVCECPGWKYRGHCRHVQEVSAKLA